MSKICGNVWYMLVLLLMADKLIGWFLFDFEDINAIMAVREPSSPSSILPTVF